MVKPINDGEAVKLTVLGLEVSEKLFNLLTPCAHGLSIAAHYLPPLALMLEGVFSITELIKDQKSDHLSRVDKGAQVLVTSLTLSVAVVGFLSLGLAALAPALPFVFTATTGLLTFAAVHRFFLIKKDPKYIALHQQKKALTEGFNQLIKMDDLQKDLPLKNRIVALGQADGEDDFKKKREFLLEQKLPANVSEKLNDFLKEYDEFSEGRESYKKFKNELGQLRAVGVMRAAFFTVGVVMTGILVAGVIANPLGAPIALGLVAMAYVAHRLGLFSKMKRAFNRAFRSPAVTTQMDDQSSLSDDMQKTVENKVTKQDAYELSDREQQVYDAHKGEGHDRALEVVNTFKEMGVEQQDVYHKLATAQNGLTHNQMMAHAEKLHDIHAKYPSLSAADLQKLNLLTYDQMRIYQEAREDHGLSHDNAHSLTQLTDKQLAAFKAHFEKNDNKDFTESYHHAFSLEP